MQLSVVVRYWMQFKAVQGTRLLPTCSPEPARLRAADRRPPTADRRPPTADGS
ncbi:MULTISPECIES: hypothetical protein [unclassified Micromonospora]|uniref:hypothetical protein n=1 Tax=Micromonospora sp. NPDC005087 TaxID=3364225 RepID=UPI0036AD6C54